MTEAQTPAMAGNLPAFRQQLAEGFGLIRQGRAGEASMMADALLAEHVDHPEAHYLAAEALVASGDLAESLAHLEAALRSAPDQSALMVKKAELLLGLNRRSEAIQVAEAAADVAGRDADALCVIGRFFSRCNDPVRAGGMYERALDCNRCNPSALYALASTQFHLGDFESAEKSLDRYLAIDPKAGQALYLRSTLRRQTVDSNHVAQLEALSQQEFPSEVARGACYYALAKELEDLGESERVFTALSKGAKIKRGTLQYDAASELAALDAISAVYTVDAMRRPAVGHDEDGPIFIVGMPRTGTTLVERMLGRHSEVQSAGELLAFRQLLGAAAQAAQAGQPGKSMVEASLDLDFAALGRDYMAGARQAAPGSRFFIDKMPANFMYCGMIRRSLPKARILHLVRDPMDSCYAVYKTLFQKAYLFSYDQEEVADYFAAYHRLMRHWHEVLPDAILDIRYEELVSDTEGQARRLLDWCGLPWQNEVLSPSDNDAPVTTASAAQVREPVYNSSVAKWRRYAESLEPMRQRLAAAGVIEA